MANSFYDPFGENQLGATPIDFREAGTVEFQWWLVDLADYTFSAAHEFVSSIPVAARVAESAQLASKTIVAGTFDAADDPDAFPSVTGDEAEALILAVDSGTPASDRTILFLDTGVSNLPIVPNGGDIGITHNAAGIFSII